MKCDRCGSGMTEEQVSVTGGLVKIKNISAWHCTHCGRVEYKPAHGDTIEPLRRQPLDSHSSV